MFCFVVVVLGGVEGMSNRHWVYHALLVQINYYYKKKLGGGDGEWRGCLIGTGCMERMSNRHWVYGEDV